MSGRCGAVAALTPGGDLHIHVALLGDTQNRIRPVHTGHRFLDDCAAFIQHQCQTDAFILQIAHGCGSTVAAGLFIDGIL